MRYSFIATRGRKPTRSRNLVLLESRELYQVTPDYIPKYMAKVIGLTREKAFESDETERAIVAAFKDDRIVSYEYNAFAKSSSLLST